MQACANIGNKGLPNRFASNIQSVEKCVKSAIQWQKNKTSNRVVCIVFGIDNFATLLVCQILSYTLNGMVQKIVDGFHGFKNPYTMLHKITCKQLFVGYAAKHGKIFIF
jgi:hypothetical protein